MSKDEEPREPVKPENEIVTVYLPMLGYTMKMLRDEAEYFEKHGIPVFPYDGSEECEDGESP